MAIDTKVRTYSPGQVVMTFGPFTMTGFADGMFIKVERAGRAFEKKRGNDGTVDRINKNIFDFTVTLNLKKTSISNDDLSTTFNSDLINNDGVHPLSIKDLNGTSLFYSESVWVAQDPSEEFTDDLANNEWQFDTGPAEKFTGGNNAVNE